MAVQHQSHSRLKVETVTTKKEAMEAALQVELDLVNGVLNPVNNYPLEKYFKSWYETFMSNISSITLNSYKATHNKLLTYFIDPRYTILQT